MQHLAQVGPGLATCVDAELWVMLVSFGEYVRETTHPMKIGVGIRRVAKTTRLLPQDLGRA